MCREGFAVGVLPIGNAPELRSRLNAGVSHVVVSAPWIPTPDWQGNVGEHSGVRFAVNCHSNVGFFRPMPAASPRSHGSRARDVEFPRGRKQPEKFCRWVTATYRTPCRYLPNLYDLAAPPPRRPLFSGNHLRIGAFGATRPLKNFMSAAGAAAEVAVQLHANLELWVSAGRAESGGGIFEAISAMIGVLPNVRLVDCGCGRVGQGSALRSAVCTCCCQLHRVIQHGDCRWCCGGRAVYRLRRHRLGARSLEGARR